MLFRRIPSIKAAALGAALIIIATAFLAIRAHATTTDAAHFNDLPPTCTSAGPCLFEKNAGSGVAVEAISRLDHGVLGKTHAPSPPTSLNGQGGVVGLDGSANTSGDNNFGVGGESTGGLGILGNTDNTNPNNLVGGVAIVGFDGDVDPTTDSNIGVFGGSHFSIGVFGGSSNTGVGTLGNSLDGIGVFARTGNADGIPLFIRNEDGGDLIHAGTQSGDQMSLDGSGNMILTGTLTQNGTPHFLTGTSDGRKVVAYAPRQSEATVEDFGESQLVSGAAFVRLEPTFAATMDLRRPYLVFITPQGQSRGLYVAQKLTSGFWVRENAGGHSTLTFDYRIVSKPFDADASRLPLAPLMHRTVVSPSLQRAVQRVLRMPDSRFMVRSKT